MSTRSSCTIGTVTVEGRAVHAWGHFLLPRCRPRRAGVSAPPGKEPGSSCSEDLPFEERLLMWWNFVARNRDEIDVAYDDWAADSGRFGSVASALARIGTTRPTWMPEH